MGQLAYMMIMPVRDITFSALLELACCQLPAKSASTKHSSPFLSISVVDDTIFLCVEKIMPEPFDGIFVR